MNLGELFLKRSLPWQKNLKPKFFLSGFIHSMELLKGKISNGGVREKEIIRQSHNNTNNNINNNTTTNTNNSIFQLADFDASIDPLLLPADQNSK